MRRETEEGGSHLGRVPPSPRTLLGLSRLSRPIHLEVETEDSKFVDASDARHRRGSRPGSSGEVAIAPRGR